MRLIASIRLSKDRDTTNSPTTQRADITDYALDHNHVIVAWPEDLDVSGGMPIRQRPGIGEYLAEDRLSEWDGIIGSRLDRLFRSQLDYLLWVRDIGDGHGKVIIDVEGGIDTSTPQGRRELNNRAQQADYERQRTSENRGKAQKRIRNEGRYGGGPIQFGYRKVRHESEDETTGRITAWYTLVPHEEYATILREIVDRMINGESANSVCLDLNKRGVPTSFDAQRIIAGRTPRGGKWETTQLLRLLRSPALKGFVMNYPKKGEKWTKPVPVIGRDGMPVRREALIDDATWDSLQLVIGNPKDRSHYRANAATLLLGVAQCGKCGGALHSERKTGRDRAIQRRYYGCAQRHYGGCDSRLIPMEELDEAVNAAILEYGDLPDYDTKRPKVGEARERKIRDIGQAIVDLTEERYVRNIMRPDFDSLMESLQTERARLQVETDPEPQPERVKTGKTIAQTWDERDIQGKRLWMLKRGWKVIAARQPDNFLTVTIEGGELFGDIEALGGPTAEEMTRPWIKAGETARARLN